MNIKTSLILSPMLYTVIYLDWTGLDWIRTQIQSTPVLSRFGSRVISLSDSDGKRDKSRQYLTSIALYKNPTSFIKPLLALYNPCTWKRCLVCRLRAFGAKI